MPTTLVLMGVAGSGKSTVGPRVAAALGVAFFDADDFHDAGAIARMAAGVPLDDAARRPWLERLHALLAAHAAEGAVLACSALTPSYRAILAEGLPGVRFVALVAPATVLGQRLADRRGHYAGPDLLASQLDTLELGGAVRTVDADRPVDEVVGAVLDAVRS